MRKISLFALALSLSIGAFAQTWTADKNHSQLNFSIIHMGVNAIEGGFRTFTATITSSKDDWSDAVIELQADVSSVNTGVEPRDNHLKSPDFFDASQYGTMTFKSTSFKKVDDKNYILTGDLTLHGVTKPVTLNATFNGTYTNQMNHKTSAGFKVTGVIKRSEFGIGAKFPAAMLSDEVTLDANTEFIKG